MSSNLMPECSSCGERNEATMMFCISCGQSLRGGAKSTRVSAMMPAFDAAHPPTGATKVPVTCGMCGRTDALNGVFCVYCGQRTAGPSQRQGVSGSGEQVAMTGTPMRPMDYSSAVNIPASVQRRQTSTFSWPLVLVGCALGAAVGVGGAFLAAKMGMERTFVQDHWPKQGLVVYTDLPGASVLLESSRENGFVVGRTGPAGALACADIDPGGYTVSLTSKKGEVLHQSVDVSAGKASAIGYPDPIVLSTR